MPTVTITDSAILALANVVALIVPLFIIAILVDASRSAERISSAVADRSADRSAILQSRRTLLAIAVGVVVEFISFNAILSVPNNDSGATPITYTWLVFTGTGLLVLLYIMFIPHIVLHRKNIKYDPKTRHWTIIVGWFGDAGLIIAACTALFIGGTEFDHIVGFIFVAMSLVIAGSMLVVTFSHRDTPEVQQPSSSTSPLG